MALSLALSGCSEAREGTEAAARSSWAGCTVLRLLVVLESISESICDRVQRVLNKKSYGRSRLVKKRSRHRVRMHAALPPSAFAAATSTLEPTATGMPALACHGQAANCVRVLFINYYYKTATAACLEVHRRLQTHKRDGAGEDDDNRSWRCPATIVRPSASWCAGPPAVGTCLRRVC